MGTQKMVCLAASRKFGGKCVAGVTLDGEWVRPVGTGAEGAVTYSEYRLDDGTEPEVLDVLEIPIGRYCGDEIHPEDFELGAGTWRRVGRLGPSTARALLDDLAVPGPEILGGRGDRMTRDEVRASQPGSLAIVHPTSLRFTATTNVRQNPQARAMFTLGDAFYNLTLTDPAWESRVKALGYATHTYAKLADAADDDVYLTVSLTDPFNDDGNCYRLVAAVIEVPAKS